MYVCILESIFTDAQMPNNYPIKDETKFPTQEKALPSLV